MSDIEEREVKEIQPQRVELIVDDSGNYETRDQTSLWRAADAAIKQGFAPPALARQGVAAVSAAILMCKQYGLPMTSMGKMYFINGVLSVHSELFTAIAKKSPDWRPFERIFIDREYNEIKLENKNLHAETYACIIRVPKKDKSGHVDYSFTLDDAKKAGLFDEKKSGSTPWYKYTKDMLYHKAKKRAFDTEYADAIQGVQMYQDIMDLNERVVSEQDKEDFESGAEEPLVQLEQKSTL